jgi:hypothetical protein
MPAKRAKPEKPHRTLRLRHEQSKDFRYCFVDGTLIQTQRDNVVLVFFTERINVVSQGGELREVKGEIAQYHLSGFEEEPVRVHEVTVRMTHKEAINLATLIVERVHKEKPDLLEKISFPGGLKVNEPSTTSQSDEPAE